MYASLSKDANRRRRNFIDSPRKPLSHIARGGTPVPKSSSPAIAPEVSPIVVLPGHCMLNQMALHRGSFIWPPKVAHGYWRWWNYNGWWCNRHKDVCKTHPSYRVPFWCKPGIYIILYHKFTVHIIYCLSVIQIFLALVIIAAADAPHSTCSTGVTPS